MDSTGIVIFLTVLILALVAIAVYLSWLPKFDATMFPVAEQLRLIWMGYIEWETKWFMAFLEKDLERQSRADCEIYLRLNSLCYIYSNFIPMRKIKTKRTQLLNFWKLDKTYLCAIASNENYHEKIPRELLSALTQFHSGNDEEARIYHHFTAYLSFHNDRVKALVNHLIVSEEELRILAIQQLLKAVDIESSNLLMGEI